MGKPQKRGLKYEKYKAKKMRAKPVGGPNPEDAKRGREKIEIKKWKRPVHKGVLKKALRRGIKTVVSPSGFTGPAKKYAKKKGMRLRK